MLRICPLHLAALVSKKKTNNKKKQTTKTKNKTKNQTKKQKTKQKNKQKKYLYIYKKNKQTQNKMIKKSRIKNDTSIENEAIQDIYVDILLLQKELIGLDNNGSSDINIRHMVHLRQVDILKRINILRIQIDIIKIEHSVVN